MGVIGAIPPDSMEWLNSFLEASLRETCTIKQRTVTNSGSGPSTVETDRASGVKCRRATQFGARERPVDAAARAQEEIVITFLITQAVEPTDRVVFASGETFEVTRELETSHQRFCKRVAAKAV